MPSVWRNNKRTDAKWLIGQLRAKLAQESGERTEPVRVLSIGSGVGYMERILLEEMPELELHVNEPSTVGMKWLREYIPSDRIYIGTGHRFDLLEKQTVRKLHHGRGFADSPPKIVRQASSAAAASGRHSR